MTLEEECDSHSISLVGEKRGLRLPARTEKGLAGVGDECQLPLCVVSILARK